ncbi:MAG TPA: elongation factor G [Phycisphaerae bacterium]|nr:elongation factor G [Phycisphaerae bacterium]
MMPSYSTADIRNIVLVGHAGAGKTSLAEAILHTTGMTNRLGSVSDGSSHLDFSEEEKERSCSIDSALCHVEHEGKHVNIIDTPGAPDFVGPAIAALVGAETAVCVISAAAGIEVNTRRMMERAGQFGLARMVVINKIDAENIDLEELLKGVQEVFGRECMPVNLPAEGGKGVVDCLAGSDGSSDLGDAGDAHTALVEAVAESDEALMEKYFESGDLDASEVRAALPKALASGGLVPVLFTAATSEVGIKELLDLVTGSAPSPVEGKQRQFAGQDEAIKPTADGPFVAQVFKVTTDPRSNIKFSVMRVHSGRLRSDTNIQVGDDRRGQRPGAVHKLQGGEHTEIDEGIAGDVVAVAKLDLAIGDVLHTGVAGQIEMPAVPTPMFSLAIEPKSRSDVEKVSGALARFTEEDPCFVADRDAATHELVIRGVGDLHLRTILSRMKRDFKLDVDTKPPKIPYKETVTGVAKEVEYTHKKQTGGAGQYARVVITLEPNERAGGYEFIDDIYGGAIDQPFRPSVDKGVQQQMREGILAGYPVEDIKVRLVDGKTHPVDSKDIAFQIAGREALKVAFAKASPVLLEPIVNIEVTVPTRNVGDIQGDLASRRGRPQGQDTLPGGMAVIRGQAPLAELADYSSRLSSITGGQGSYTMELSHYEQVPGNIQQQIIEQAKKARQEEREK